MKNNPTMNLAH